MSNETMFLSDPFFLRERGTSPFKSLRDDALIIESLSLFSWIFTDFGFNPLKIESMFLGPDISGLVGGFP